MREWNGIIYLHLDLSSPNHPHPAALASCPLKVLYPGFPVATGKQAGFTLSDQMIGLASSRRAISSAYFPHLWPGCRIAFTTLSSFDAGISGPFRLYSPRLIRNWLVGIIEVDLSRRKKKFFLSIKLNCSEKMFFVKIIIIINEDRRNNY